MSTIAAGHGVALGPVRRRPTRSTGSVRLTRRGRYVFLALFLGLLLVGLTMLGDRSAATDGAGDLAETRTVVVGEGDTLWGIASEIAEPGGTREMVYHIQELNALPSASLERGQELAVPVG